MKKKNKKKIYSSKKNLKGFTLVELLAVIVILAIIMIIAIPAVIDTMSTAKKKSMVEFAQKVELTGQRKYMEDINFYNLRRISRGNYIYSIKSDLGLSGGTGGFDGYFIIFVDGEYYEEHLLLWDNESFINKWSINNNEVTTSDIEPVSYFLSDINYMLNKNYDSPSGMSKDDFMYLLKLKFHEEAEESYNCEDYLIVDAGNPSNTINMCFE